MMQTHVQVMWLNYKLCPLHTPHARIKTFIRKGRGGVGGVQGPHYFVLEGIPTSIPKETFSHM